MDNHAAAAVLGAAVNPLLGRDLAEFAEARQRFAATRPVPTTVAVIGLTPGEGRSSVAALLALTVAGFSDRRIAVLDTVAAPGGAHPPVAGVPSVRDVAGRTVTALLSGDVRQGRLPGLLDPAAGPVVGRRRLRAAQTPGAAVPVLSLPPGGPGFAPQFVEQSLQRLRYRADLVVIDTPAGPGAPVLHGVMQHADHFLLVVRGDGDVDRRLQAVARWLASAPGRERNRTASAVVIARGWNAPDWDFRAMDVQLIQRDEGLRRRRLDRLGRQAVIGGLTLAAQIAEVRAHSPLWPPAVASPPVPGGPLAGGQVPSPSPGGFVQPAAPDPSIFGHR